MKRELMRRIATLVLIALCGVVLWGPGCKTPSWGGKKTAQSVPGITAPHERIADLQSQRDRAKKMSPAEAEQLAARLAPICAEEEDPIIRAEIVRTLGALNSQTARQALLASGQDPNSRVRIAACKAWAEIGDDAAANELARILSSDTDQDVRHAAAKALGETRGPQVIAALGSALEDHDPAMQYVAMDSLKKVTGKNFGKDARQWQQYVQGQTPTDTETGIAQKMRDIF